MFREALPMVLFWSSTLVLGLAFIAQTSKLMSVILVFGIIVILGAAVLAALGSYFIALTYIIVYIGAIAILFLFIIMIYDGQPFNSTSFQPLYVLLLSSATFGWPSAVFPGLFQISQSSALLGAELWDIQSLSIFMFNGWGVGIILIGILLTSTLIGILETL